MSIWRSVKCEIGELTGNIPKMVQVKVSTLLRGSCPPRSTTLHSLFDSIETCTSQHKGTKGASIWDSRYFSRTACFLPKKLLFINTRILVMSMIFQETTRNDSCKIMKSLLQTSDYGIQIMFRNIREDSTQNKVGTRRKINVFYMKL